MASLRPEDDLLGAPRRPARLRRRLVWREGTGAAARRRWQRDRLVDARVGLAGGEAWGSQQGAALWEGGRVKARRGGVLVMAAAVRVKGGEEADACRGTGVASPAAASSGRERSGASSAAATTADCLRQQPYVLGR